MTILDLFRSGLDTVEIAKRLGLDNEAEAYNMLNREIDSEYHSRRAWEIENERRLKEAEEAI